VFSFCMCPGGVVVPTPTEPQMQCTNGMSNSHRSSPRANAGIVVEVGPRDFPAGPLGGVAFQRRWEAAAFRAGGEDYAAPCQRVGDFLAGRASTDPGDVVPSYRPGVKMTDIARCLPDYVTAAIRAALPGFDRQLPGFAMADAVLTGVETRTSSPVRIERDRTLQSVNTKGLFPAGEGAGYAGGILSAGVDGIRVGEALALSLTG